MNGVEATLGRGLRRIAVAAGALAIACAATQILVEVVAVGLLGKAVPQSVDGWLRGLADDRLVTIVELTVLQIPLFAALAVVLLGLATTVWRSAPTATVTSTLLGLIGISVYLASNPALGLASLSDAYALGADAAARASVVAAAAALLAAYEGIGLDVGLVLILVAVAALSAAMWRSRSWGRLAPAIGVLGTAVSSTYYVAMPLGSSRIFILEIGSAIFIAWIALVTLGLRGRDPDDDA